MEIMKLTVNEIVKWTGGRLSRGRGDASVAGISTDTRTLKKGELFVALSGENFDGHKFINEALKKGACGVVVEKGRNTAVTQARRDACVIETRNTFLFLQKLAHAYKKKFSVQTIAVTGSSGKTTTKDFIAAMLSQKYNVLKAKKSYNNEIGVPLTLLELNEKHDVCVLEFAMRNKGDIAALCEIAEPDAGAITNVGVAHIGRLGSQENIAKAKGELFSYLRGKNGGANDYSPVLVVNEDDTYVRKIRGQGAGGSVQGRSKAGSDPTHRNIISFSVKSSGADVCVEKKRVVKDKGFELEIKIAKSAPLSAAGKTFSLFLPLLGEHNISNMLAAVCFALHFHLPINDIQTAAKHLSPAEGRLALYRKNGLKILDDSFNANPISCMSALKTLGVQVSAKRKIAVLGDMLELGKNERVMHQEVGREVPKYADVCVSVGKLGHVLALETQRKRWQDVYFFSDSDFAARFLRNFVKSGDAVLVKGSHAMHMGKITEALLRANY